VRLQRRKFTARFMCRPLRRIANQYPLDARLFGGLDRPKYQDGGQWGKLSTATSLDFWQTLRTNSYAQQPDSGLSAHFKLVTHGGCRDGARNPIALKV
jgi:hypothetical protein